MLYLKFHHCTEVHCELTKTGAVVPQNWFCWPHESIKFLSKAMGGFSQITHSKGEFKGKMIFLVYISESTGISNHIRKLHQPGLNSQYKKFINQKMVRVLVAISFLLHLANAHSRIDFSYPTESSSSCDCKLITECHQINELAIARKWNELKNGYTHCGFNRKVPKYCCPSK